MQTTTNKNVSVSSTPQGDQIYLVPSGLMQQVVENFTYNHRSWPGYSADRLEVMLKWYGTVPPNAFYAGFDNNRDLLKFTVRQRAYPSMILIEERENLWHKFLRLIGR